MVITDQHAVLKRSSREIIPPLKFYILVWSFSAFAAKYDIYVTAKRFLEDPHKRRNIIQYVNVTGPRKN